ncbi:head GIN domain-containing protein [Bizionia sediminis]|uniref:Head GIN domain-containing protein n=1 Tax=Bizionia sediminis TaxID=1737064 RepID=A0ABW5KUN5_9FLAO
MKNYLFAGLFYMLVVAGSFGQQEKMLGDFKTLKVYDRIEVALIKSDVNKVVLKGKYTDDVVIVNKNGTLKIRMSLQKLFDGDETSVELYYKHIDVIDVNEGAFVGSNEVFNQFDLKLHAQEGGSIKLQVENITYLETKAITGGVVRVSGTAKNQDIAINTGGSYLGSQLQSNQANVIIQAAGEAHIFAQEFVDAKVRAGGTVYVYGNPKELKERTVLGGQVIIKDNN